MAGMAHRCHRTYTGSGRKDTQCIQAHISQNTQLRNRRVRRSRRAVFTLACRIPLMGYRWPCCGCGMEERKQARTGTQTANLSAERAFLFASSSSRSLGGALVSSDARRRAQTNAISSTAESNGASFAFDGLLNPLIFLTNWSDASRISSSVTGGSKLNKFLIFLHMIHY